MICQLLQIVLPVLRCCAGAEQNSEKLAGSELALDTCCLQHVADVCFYFKCFTPLLARWPGRAALRLRPLDPAHYQRDIARFTQLFNQAWANNWGAEPVGAAEAATIARVMRPMTRAGAILFAEYQGEPIGVASVIPNLEEATAPLNGRLLPFGWARVAHLMLTGRSRTGRLPVIGVAPAWRHHPAGAMALGLLLAGCIAAARARAWQELEISWVLPQNLAMQQTCDRLGAPETGRWRIWQTPLG